MVDTKKITQLDPGSTPLDGSELMEMVQSGGNVKIPASAFPPIGGSYLTLTGIGALTGSRRVVAGSNITFVDTGPGGTVTISASGSATGFGDGWNWTTTVNRLRFQFPTILADWLEVDDDGEFGSLFLGGLDTIEIDSNDFLSLFAAGTAEIEADIIRLQGNNGIELDGTVGEVGQVPVSGGPGAEVTWGTASNGPLTLTDHSDSYEVQLSDANTGIVNPVGNGANGYFIPGHSSIDFDLGTFFVFINGDFTKTVTVTMEEDQMRLAQDGSSTTSFTIGPGGMATVIKVFGDSATEWFVIGNQIS